MKDPHLRSTACFMLCTRSDQNLISGPSVPWANILVSFCSGSFSPHWPWTMSGRAAGLSSPLWQRWEVAAVPGELSTWGRGALQAAWDQVKAAALLCMVFFTHQSFSS